LTIDAFAASLGTQAKNCRLEELGNGLYHHALIVRTQPRGWSVSFAAKREKCCTPRPDALVVPSREHSPTYPKSSSTTIGSFLKVLVFG
jgi:hypothetical protein